MIARIRAAARRLLERPEAGVQLWPLPRRRDPVVDEVLEAAEAPQPPWSIEAYRAMRDADPVLGPLWRSLPPLQPWQVAAVDAFMGGRPLLTTTELAARARRSSKLAAQAHWISTELAAGGHPHVLGRDGLSCPGGFCTAEQLRPPAPQPDLEDLVPRSWVDESWELDEAAMAQLRPALASRSDPAVSWSSTAGDPAADLAAASELLEAAAAAEPEPPRIHAKLLDDTRLCPVADGGLPTVFHSIVDCALCLDELARPAP